MPTVVAYPGSLCHSYTWCGWMGGGGSQTVYSAQASFGPRLLTEILRKAYRLKNFLACSTWRHLWRYLSNPIQSFLNDYISDSGCPCLSFNRLPTRLSDPANVLRYCCRLRMITCFYYILEKLSPALVLLARASNHFVWFPHSVFVPLLFVFFRNCAAITKVSVTKETRNALTSCLGDVYPAGRVCSICDICLLVLFLRLKCTLPIVPHFGQLCTRFPYIQ